MKNKLIRLIALTLLAVSIVSLTGCGDRLGKKTTYYANSKLSSSHHITLNKGWSRKSGTGHANKAYYEVDWVGYWDLTGDFDYTSTSVTMKTGNKKNKTFTNKSMVSMSDDTKTLTVYGEKYKY